MLSFLAVLVLSTLAVKAAVVPATTEPPPDTTTELDTNDQDSSVVGPILPPRQPHVCIFLCIRGFHCGPVPCDDPTDSGCIGCVPDEPSPCTTTTHY
ncbi:hypothetical protein PRIPAC_80495 [Pristionchus pacificus]|uniref:Uncharacterized protein n=1 Tax=Pristionchus pacificus TaxID=54126 RepID=A0A454Y2Z5_PRIPA|nr:hypothetical protein PRIPAC_80495 [Pristionchus pacificus]|eukprot:PDM79418.1 hypothetical protein PRIPAC_31997 [Pristionchus pacificus]